MLCRCYLLINKYVSDVDPAYDRNHAIRMACKNGHIDMAQLLLSDGRVDPSANNNISIRDAVIRGHFEVVHLLMRDKRTDPSADKQCVLKSVLEYINVDTLRLLLADDCVMFTSDIVRRADAWQPELDDIFVAAGSRFWPSIIGNDIECLPRAS